MSYCSSLHGHQSSTQPVPQTPSSSEDDSETVAYMRGYTSAPNAWDTDSSTAWQDGQYSANGLVSDSAGSRTQREQEWFVSLGEGILRNRNVRPPSGALSTARTQTPGTLHFAMGASAAGEGCVQKPTTNTLRRMPGCSVIQPREKNQRTCGTGDGMFQAADCRPTQLNTREALPNGFCEQGLHQHSLSIHKREHKCTLWSAGTELCEIRLRCDTTKPYDCQLTQVGTHNRS
jgi:hypothetical protein